MKTRNEAARILLANGWTFEEVEAVLRKNGSLFDGLRDPFVPYRPDRPYRKPYEPYIWLETNTNTPNGVD